MEVVGELRARIPSYTPPLWLLAYMMPFVYLIVAVFTVLLSLAAFRLKATVLHCHPCEYIHQGRGAATHPGPRTSHLACVLPVTDRPP